MLNISILYTCSVQSKLTLMTQNCAGKNEEFFWNNSLRFKTITNFFLLFSKSKYCLTECSACSYGWFHWFLDWACSQQGKANLSFLFSFLITTSLFFYQKRPA